MLPPATTCRCTSCAYAPPALPMSSECAPCSTTRPCCTTATKSEPRTVLSLQRVRARAHSTWQQHTTAQ
jgi:hypothetical protein